MSENSDFSDISENSDISEDFENSETSDSPETSGPSESPLKLKIAFSCFSLRKNAYLCTRKKITQHGEALEQ